MGRDQRHSAALVIGQVGKSAMWQKATVDRFSSKLDGNYETGLLGTDPIFQLSQGQHAVLCR